MIEDWSPLFEGFFLDDPGDRHLPPTLRAFIDMARDMPGAERARYLPPNPFLVSGGAAPAGAKRRRERYAASRA